MLHGSEQPTHSPASWPQNFATHVFPPQESDFVGVTAFGLFKNFGDITSKRDLIISGFEQVDVESDVVVLERKE